MKSIYHFLIFLVILFNSSSCPVTPCSLSEQVYLIILHPCYDEFICKWNVMQGYIELIKHPFDGV